MRLTHDDNFFGVITAGEVYDKSIEYQSYLFKVYAEFILPSDFPL
jgi:hypothetical protein